MTVWEAIDTVRDIDSLVQFLLEAATGERHLNASPPPGQRARLEVGDVAELLVVVEREVFLPGNANAFAPLVEDPVAARVTGAVALERRRDGERRPMIRADPANGRQVRIRLLVVVVQRVLEMLLVHDLRGIRLVAAQAAERLVAGCARRLLRPGLGWPAPNGRELLTMLARYLRRPHRARFGGKNAVEGAYDARDEGQ